MKSRRMKHLSCIAERREGSRRAGCFFAAERSLTFRIRWGTPHFTTAFGNRSTRPCSESLFAPAPPQTSKTDAGFLPVSWHRASAIRHISWRWRELSLRPWATAQALVHPRSSRLPFTIMARAYVETSIPSFYFEARSEPEMVARCMWTRQ